MINLRKISSSRTLIDDHADYDSAPFSRRRGEEASSPSLAPQQSDIAEGNRGTARQRTALPRLQDDQRDKSPLRENRAPSLPR